MLQLGIIEVKMIAENQIRAQLGHYLADELSLDNFEDWLVQRSWNMHNDSLESAQKLVSAIELRLAEYSSGHLDECSLKNELRPFATVYTVPIMFGVAVPFVEQEPPNNTVPEAGRPPVLSFRSRGMAASASQGATALFDTSRAVELV